MKQNPTQRVIQITFHKCGSQWIRDVLNTPEMERFSGIALDGRSENIMAEGWPDQAANTFLGPLYNVSPQVWEANRKPGDRALVILRDPRDRLVSWVYSMAYSHSPSPSVQLFRDLILPMDQHSRILFGTYEFAWISKLFYEWAVFPESEHTLVTRYETFVESQGAEFRRVVDFLGWPVPDEMLNEVVDRFSFAKRSGRDRGEENVYSHYRKGEPGDWRRHFDREAGRIWEHIMPGLLTKLGYEQDDRWFEQLPEKVEAQPESAASAPPDSGIHQLNVEIASLREKLKFVSDEFERMRAFHLSRTNELNDRIRTQRHSLVRRLKRLRKVTRRLQNKRLVRLLRWLGKKRRKSSPGA